MNRKQYERLTERRLKGRKVRLNRPLDSAQAHIAQGRIMTIEKKRAGLALIGPMCWSCGVQLRFIHVEPEAVELLPEGT